MGALSKTIRRVLDANFNDFNNLYTTYSMNKRLSGKDRVEKVATEIQGPRPVNPPVALTIALSSVFLFVAACLARFVLSWPKGGDLFSLLSWSIAGTGIGVTVAATLLWAGNAAGYVVLPAKDDKLIRSIFIASVLTSSAALIGTLIHNGPSRPIIKGLHLVDAPQDRKSIVNGRLPTVLHPHGSSYSSELGILAVAVVTGLHSDVDGGFRFHYNLAIYNANTNIGTFGSSLPARRTLETACPLDLRPSLKQIARGSDADLPIFVNFYGDSEAGAAMGVKELVKGSNYLWVQVVDDSTGLASDAFLLPITVLPDNK